MIQNLSSIFQSMPVLLELLCILVFGSIIFVWGVRYSNIKDEFKHFNLPKWLRDLVGIFKFAFAIMLLNDNLQIVLFGAIGIAVLMIAAILTHLRLKSPFPRMLPSCSLLCACLIISYLCTELLAQVA
jgi:O-antigen/teichoic acid export membrane protein